jgi:hypothetical protein
LLEQHAGNDKWEAEIRNTRNDFMAAATHLLPYDPVAKKRLSGSKKGAGMISSALDVAGDDQTPGGYWLSWEERNPDQCVSKRASAIAGCKIYRPELGPRRRPYFYPKI